MYIFTFRSLWLVFRIFDEFYMENDMLIFEDFFKTNIGMIISCFSDTSMLLQISSYHDFDFRRDVNRQRAYEQLERLKDQLLLQQFLQECDEVSSVYILLLLER